MTLSVWPYTDDEVPPCGRHGSHGRVVYYPVRLGYGSTIYKFQGAELEHVTVWLDRPGVPAAGYVALSRVKKDTDYLIGGIVGCEHFVPAR